MTDIFKDKTQPAGKVSLSEMHRQHVMSRMQPEDAPGTHVPGMWESQKTDKAVRSPERPRKGHDY
jgi:hypothetical protein